MGLNLSQNIFHLKVVILCFFSYCSFYVSFKSQQEKTEAILKPSLSIGKHWPGK